MLKNEHNQNQEAQKQEFNEQRLFNNIKLTIAEKKPIQKLIGDPSIKISDLTEKDLEQSYYEVQKESASSRWLMRFYYSQTLSQHILILSICVLLIAQSVTLI